MILWGQGRASRPPTSITHSFVACVSSVVHVSCMVCERSRHFAGGWHCTHIDRRNLVGDEIEGSVRWRVAVHKFFSWGCCQPPPAQGSRLVSCRFRPAVWALYLGCKPWGQSHHQPFLTQHNSETLAGYQFCTLHVPAWPQCRTASGDFTRPHPLATAYWHLLSNKHHAARASPACMVEMVFFGRCVGVCAGARSACQGSAAGAPAPLPRTPLWAGRVCVPPVA